jgi:hypothetical protein
LRRSTPSKFSQLHFQQKFVIVNVAQNLLHLKIGSDSADNYSDAANKLVKTEKEIEAINLKINEVDMRLSVLEKEKQELIDQIDNSVVDSPHYKLLLLKIESKNEQQRDLKKDKDYLRQVNLLSYTGKNRYGIHVLIQL